MAASPDCVMESVEPEKLSGAETVAVWRALVPFPTNTPVSVVEPVPPDAAPSAVAISSAAKCEVEEAKTPACAHSGEEVAAEITL